MKQPELEETDPNEKNYWLRWYTALVVFLLLQILLYTWLTNWLQ